MPHTETELLKLYGQLRTQILTRHFACNQHFRTELLSDQNRLGKWSLFGTCADHGFGDLRVDFSPDSLPGLLSQPQPEETLARWQAVHAADNPLIGTGMLLLCFAVEHSLGSPTSLDLIERTLDSLGSLYKFSGNHFDGYILRWDERRSDRWMLDSTGRLQTCCDFPRDSSGRYIHCLAPNDRRFKPNDPTPFRMSEPSMDELSGLLAGYVFAHSAVAGDDEASTRIRGKIETQVRNLGDYLAQFSYLLVRPAGNFTLRGAAGILPALAFPFGAAFKRIVGDPFAPRGGFVGALKSAGVWDDISAAFIAGGVLGVVTLLPILFYVLFGVAGIVGGTATGSFAVFAAALSLNPVVMGEALALLLGRGAFDAIVDQKSDGRSEFALAFLLSQLSPSHAWEFLNVVTSFISISFASNVMIFAALTAVGDPDTTVADRFASWLSSRRRNRLDTDVRGADHPRAQVAPNTSRPLADAAALALNGGADNEAAVAGRLEELFNAFQGPHAIWLDSNAPDAKPELPVDFTVRDPRNQSVITPVERPDIALEYMACLALSWLHLRTVKALSQKGSEAGFPAHAPDLSVPGALPEPQIPEGVVNAARRGAVPVPLSAMASALFARGGRGTLDPFRSDIPPAEAPVSPPTAVSLSVSAQLACDGFWPSSKTVTRFINPPAKPSDDAILIIEEHRAPSTSADGVAAASALLEASVFVDGQTGRAGEVRIDVTLSRGWGCGAAVQYLANWVVWWDGPIGPAS